MFIYRIATEADLERIWDFNISQNPDDARWAEWKSVALANNKSGQSKTFVVLWGEQPIGEVTLILSPESGAIRGRLELCNGKDIANMNAFRIKKEFEGQGHVSKLLKLAEDYARSIGIKTLTIGVEEKEARNLAIYKHWGFVELMHEEIEDGEPVLYFKKSIV